LVVTAEFDIVAVFRFVVSVHEPTLARVKVLVAWCANNP
jgi:hypothetical protein